MVSIRDGVHPGLCFSGSCTGSTKHFHEVFSLPGSNQCGSTKYIGIASMSGKILAASVLSSTNKSLTASAFRRQFRKKNIITKFQNKGMPKGVAAQPSGCSRVKIQLWNFQERQKTQNNLFTLFCVFFRSSE